MRAAVPPVKPGRTKWNFWDLVVVGITTMALTLVLTALSVVVLGAAGFDVEDPLDPVVYSTAGIAVYAAAMIAIWAIIVKWRGATWQEIGFRPTDSRVLAGMAPLAFVLVIVNALILLPISIYFMGEPPANTSPLESETLAVADVLLLAVPMVIVAPIVEEIIFRGLLFQYLRGAFGTSRRGLVGAVALSALLFGLLHVVVPPIFVMGVVLAMLTNRFNSIVPGIVLHAVYNGLLVGSVLLVVVSG
jgi:membrane protease YdiL (CAAX protease family)